MKWTSGERNGYTNRGYLSHSATPLGCRLLRIFFSEGVGPVVTTLAGCPCFSFHLIHIIATISDIIFCYFLWKIVPLIRSIISWCCIFILLDWLILRWHFHSFWMMFPVDLSRSSEKDMFAVLYHKNKGPAEAFGCPFYRVMRRLRPKSVRWNPRVHNGALPSTVTSVSKQILMIIIMKNIWLILFPLGKYLIAFISI